MSTKKELAAAKAENTELRRMLSRIFPSGDRRAPHALWKAVRRLSDHARWLDWLSDPTPSQPTATSHAVNVDHEEATGVGSGGKSANQPILPGIRLADRAGDRNLYHSGYEADAELKRLTKTIEQLIDQSADWLRGLDRDSIQLPAKRRPRCDECDEVMATVWRYCPYCATARL